MLLGKKILVLHAHLGLTLSLSMAAIFSPPIFCLGFHRPVQLPKHIFCYLICKRFFIPLSLFVTPHFSRALPPDRPTPGCFLHCAVSLLPCEMFNMPTKSHQTLLSAPISAVHLRGLQGWTARSKWDSSCPFSWECILTQSYILLLDLLWAKSQTILFQRSVSICFRK